MLIHTRALPLSVVVVAVADVALVVVVVVLFPWVLMSDLLLESGGVVSNRSYRSNLMNVGRWKKEGQLVLFSLALADPVG